MNINGYETKTTFWDDFSIADVFGKGAITDTYKRAKAEWQNNTEYITEFVMVLNWKCWQHYENGNKELSKLYSDLYYKADAWCCENLKGDALKYYYRTTD